MTKARLKVFTAVLLCLIAFVSFKMLTRDSLLKSASRLGDSVIESKSDLIWQFISKEERTTYGLSQAKFDKFWRNVVGPRTKQLSNYRVAHASENGLSVELFNSHHKKAILLEISGNQGEYYCPYFIATICYSCAMLDAKARSTPIPMDEWFTYLADWYRQNKGALLDNSIGGLKLNIGSDFQTVDEIIAKYEAQALEIKSSRGGMSKAAQR